MHDIIHRYGITEEIRNRILKNKSQALAVERKIAGFIKIDINQTDGIISKKELLYSKLGSP